MNGLFREINSSLLIGQITWLGVLESPLLYGLRTINYSDSSLNLSSLKYFVVGIVIEIDF